MLHPRLILALAALLIVAAASSASSKQAARGPAIRKARPAAGTSAPNPKSRIHNRQARLEKVALEIFDLKTGDNVTAVRRALEQIDGVQAALIDPKTGLAVVDFDPSRTALPAFLAACGETGFPAVEYRVESRFPKPIKLKGG